MPNRKNHPRDILGPHYRSIACAMPYVNQLLQKYHEHGYRYVFDICPKLLRPGADYREVNIRIFDLDGSNSEPVASTGQMAELTAYAKALELLTGIVTERKEAEYIPGTKFRRWTPPVPTGAMLN